MASDHHCIDGSDAFDRLDGSDAFDRLDWRQLLTSWRSELISKEISEGPINRIMAVLEWSEKERDQLKANYEDILKTLRDIKADLKKILDAKDQTIDELRTRIEEHHVVMDSASEALVKLRNQIIEKDGELAAYKEILGLRNPSRA